MTERALDTVTEITITEVDSANGMEKIIQKLDSLLLRDEYIKASGEFRNSISLKEVLECILLILLSSLISFRTN